MRAVVITKPGGPEVLDVRQVPEPKAGPGEVLVRVKASALNRADLLQREGHYPAPPGSPTDVPGLEFAGEIAVLGAGVDRWRVGDRVFGIVGGGAHAEYVVTHADALAAIPANLSWIEAAAVPEVFITAHDALVTQAQLRPGENVLIHAVASGVGIAATQLARAWGGRPYGTVRTPAKLDAVRQYGLIDGIGVGDDPQSVVARAQEWTGGHGMDVTLDLVGGPYLDASISAAALKGRIVLIGTMAGRTATISVGTVLGKRLTIRGTVLRSRGLEEKVAATEAFVRDVVPLLASGEVRPTVDCVFALRDVAEAHRRLASNATVGKVVLSF